MLFFLAAWPGSDAKAQESYLPEGRTIVQSATDLYGGDLRSIFDTSIEICRDACLAEKNCRGFTFNDKAQACFLKSEIGEAQFFDGARSARIERPDPGQHALAQQRAADLEFAAGYLFAASDYAKGLGLIFPADSFSSEALLSGAQEALAAGNPEQAFWDTATVVVMDDKARDWLDLSTQLVQAAAYNQNMTGDYNWQSRLAAINAYLRADTPQLQTEALVQIAATMEILGEGSSAIPALRLAQNIAPSPDNAAALERVIGLYGFHIVDTTVDSDAAQPRICVNFSESLAQNGVEFADFVRVQGEDLPVEAKDAQLCIDGVTHGRTYQITLREGVPSVSGEMLQVPVELELHVRDRNPQLRFAGSAYVLPRSRDAAIPVIGVNAPVAELSIYRVAERNLRAVMRDGLFGGFLAGYDRDNLAGQLGEKLWSGTGDLQVELNKDVTTTLPLGEAIASFQPGVYALVAAVPGADFYAQSATQWFVVTDLGLTTLGGNDGLNVFVRSLATAEPVAGATAQLVAVNNAILGEVVTDAEGHARFDPGLARGIGGNAPALVTVAAHDSDFAFLRLDEAAFDLSDRGVEGRAAALPVDVFIATERGIYRPGESVHATVLARDETAAAVTGLPLTAIVMRPDGVEHARVLLGDQGAGGRAFEMALAPAAQRGSWKLRIHADPEEAALATATFLVEDFVPERIDFALTLEDRVLAMGEALVIGVDADYLYGAPAAGLPVEGEVSLVMAESLAAFPGFRFGRNDSAFASGYEAVAGGYVTDPGGLVAVPVTVPVIANADRPMLMTTSLRLADGSGRPVERTLTREVMPDGTILGIKPLFDGAAPENGEAAFEVIAVNPDLGRSEGQAEWVLNRVETTYQWYELDGYWNYEPMTRRERIASGQVALGAEPSRIAAAVGWGEYELRVSMGAAVAAVGFQAGWYAAEGVSTTPDRLEVGLDRASYALGDTVKVRLNARFAGKVLLNVISDRLVAMQAADVPEGESVLEVPVTADWGPGAYVSATLLRPMDVAAGHNPARAIGLSWAGVDPGDRQLQVTVTTPDTVDPRGVMQAAVKIGNLRAGAEAWVTLAAVDAGILNMTGYAAPDPDGYYFGQRKLGVEIRDVYGRLIDGLSGTRGLVRSGGDGALARGAPPPTEKLVAFFSGPLKVGADGTAMAEFDIPDFNGTVRVMAVAWTDYGVGHAAKDVLVRDPVVASIALPRFLAPGDSSRMLVTLAHASGPSGEVGLNILTEGGVLLGEVPAQTVALSELGRAEVAVPLRALEVGDWKVTVQITTPDGKVLTRDLLVPVRANDPIVARQSRVPLAANGGELVIGPEIFAGLAPGSAHATLSIGPLARFDAPGLLSALDTYPFGCTEQITSKALPLLYFDEVAEAMGMGDRDKVGLRIDQAIAGVLANQSSAGSFGLWSPGEGDLWLDAYVTDFLSRARIMGHVVPDQAFRSAIANLRNAVNYAQDFENGGEALAYALMVLAREGAASIGDLRYYADVKALEFATPLAKAQLGVALAAYGDQRRADAMFALAGSDDAFEAETSTWRVDFGSAERDAAAVLALAVEAGSNAVDIEALARRVGGFGNGQYRSTQENMWTLLAAHALVEQATDGSVTVNGAVPDGPLVRLFEDPLPDGQDQTFRNNSAAAIDAVLTTFGIPTEAEPAGGNGYRIERAYFTLEGEPVAADAIVQNQRLVALLTVTPERDVQARLIIDDPLPAGLEIENPNLLSSGSLAGLEWLSAGDVARHVEFRSDRFVAAVDWSGTSGFQLAYMVRAISPGAFHQPAASVEDMYRPAYRARTEAGTVVVGRPE